MTEKTDASTIFNFIAVLRSTAVGKARQAARSAAGHRTGNALMAIVLIAALFVPTASPARAETPETPLPNYVINATLDYAEGALTAEESVLYYNNVGQDLESLVFTVTPAALGAFQVTSATVAGQPVQPSLQGTTLELPLAQPLPPGASVTVEIEFSSVIPAPGNLRYGRGNGITALGNWFPIMSPWRTGAAEGPSGWSRHSYVHTGDAFFTTTADYDVTVDVNADVTIAHTGELVKHEGQVWQFRASKVRDFALAMSTRYETSSVVVGNTTITAFYLPEHATPAQQYLRSAQESVAWFNANLMEYPYSTLHIAETNTNDATWVGQEYPNVVFISSIETANGGGIGSYLDYLVVHEVLHQWFYGLVGNDQVYQPWLDEATVTYVTYLYFKDNYPQVFDTLWSRSKSRYQAALQTWGDKPVNTSIYDYDDENHYFAIVYSGGAVFLDDLRRAIGDDAFFGFLRTYLSEHLYGIATADDFLAAAQAETTVNIAPVVSEYFTYVAYQHPTPAPSPTPSASATGGPTSTAEPTVAPSPAPSPTSPPTLTATPAAASSPTSNPPGTPTGEPATPIPAPAATATPAEAGPFGWGEGPIGYWPIAATVVVFAVAFVAWRRQR